MDNNEQHRLTAEEVESSNEQAYYIVKKCIDCQMSNPNYEVEAFDMPFPTLESAKETIKGFIKIGLKQHTNGEVIDGILHLTDDEGDTHRYVQGVIKGKPVILWQTLDDVQANKETQEIQDKFNDIISGMEFDTTTE